MVIKFNYKNYTPIHEGGEGLIFKYDNKIIKIYKPNVDIKTAKIKIEALITAKSLPKEIIKPIDIVVNNNNEFIGYIMNEVKDGEEIKKLINKKFVLSNNITTQNILKMLVKIKETLDILHKRKIFIGDLNDKNILFDKNFDVYFIDCDSWSIDNNKCVMYMDLFLDPLIKGINFNAKTDTYSFAIVAWEVLTRIHPFGGTYKLNPNMNITDRMKHGISVIDNDDIIIPRIAKSWRNLSPQLLSAFKSIYENKKRVLNDELVELYDNLTYCSKNDDFYYSKYLTCPLCDANAKLVIKPISHGLVGGLKLFKLLDSILVKTVLNNKTYIDNDDNIIDIKTNRKITHEFNTKYYFTSDSIIMDKAETFIICRLNNEYRIDKKYKSDIIVNDDIVYFISKQNSLSKLTITKYGNALENIDMCAIESYFDVYDDKYCIINHYFSNTNVNICGNIIDLNYTDDIINYGIHYDQISNSWLIILENKSNKFMTYVIKNATIDYKNDAIHYIGLLSSICFNNNVIFIPMDGNIRGYSYAKAIFKNFECDIVNDNSKLIKVDGKFIIINDENIYSLE